MGGERPLAPEVVSATCDELLSRPERQRALYLRNSSLAARPEVVRELTHRSFRLRSTDPPQALRIGRLALRLARCLGLGLPARDLAVDVFAEALANLGHLLQLQEKYVRADRLLGQARLLAERGTGKPEVRSYVLWRLGTLRRSQTRFSEAVEALSEAEVLFQRLGDTANAAGVRAALGLTHLYSNEPERALEVMRSVRELFSDGLEPDLVFMNLHNMLLCFEALGEPHLALQEMERAEVYYRKLATPALRLRAWWLKGRLCCSVGRLAEAARYLERIRGALLERKLHYDASVASLDLALVYAKQRKPHLVYQLASETQALFTAREVPKEASALLLVFAKAAEHWRADATLLEGLLRDLTPIRRATGR